MPAVYFIDNPLKLKAKKEKTLFLIFFVDSQGLFGQYAFLPEGL